MPKSWSNSQNFIIGELDMNQSLSLLDAQLSDIDQLLVLIHEFYQHFDYSYLESEKRLTLEELFKTPTTGCIYLQQISIKPTTR